MNENADWDLLSRYLAGECSESEERQVDAWLREDPENKELLETLRRIWEVSERPRDQDVPTEEEMSADRERLLRAIREERNTTDIDREVHRRDVSVPEELVAPFRNRLTQILMVAAFLVGGVIVALQLGGEWDVGTDESHVREIATARGERTTIRLADSTKVWLSVDTKLRVPETFDDQRRRVELSGEAYFEVAPDTDRPFIVTSGSAQVRVLGTKFGVTAYSADSSVQVVVREGRVALGPESGGADRTATLRSGELGHLTGTERRVTTRRVDVDTYLGWLDSKLDFDDAPLPEVARQLERWYDVEVQLQDKALVTRRLTASFDSTSATSVAEIIATTLGIQYRVEEQKIIFTTE